MVWTRRTEKTFDDVGRGVSEAQGSAAEVRERPLMAALGPLKVTGRSKNARPLWRERPEFELVTT